MSKTKEYYHEAEENIISSMIEDLDWGDADARPSISDHVNHIMKNVNPVFHIDEEIKLMINLYIESKI